MKTKLTLFTAVIFISTIGFAQNESLWGTTTKGGNYDKGVIYKYDLNLNTLFVMHHFNDTNGANPFGKLQINSNGTIYGITSSGGKAGSGVLFSYDTASHTFYKIKDITKHQVWSGVALTNTGDLIGFVRDKKFPQNWYVLYYNATQDSIFYRPGDNGLRTGPPGFEPVKNGGGFLAVGSEKIMSINASGFLGGWQYSFSSSGYGLDGYTPNCKLVKSRNGQFYGHTTEGKPSSQTTKSGVIFRGYTTKNYKRLQYFNWGNAGPLNPVGQMVETDSAVFFGVTIDGGQQNYGKGTIYKYDANIGTNGSITRVHVFNGLNGAEPRAGMSRLNGKLYGVTTEGGSNGAGVIFEFEPDSNTYKVLHHFKSGVGTSGGRPADYSALLAIKECQSPISNVSISGCDTVESITKKYKWASSGIYTDTLSNISGCDSVLRLQVTVNKGTFNSINETSCFKYLTPSGKYSITSSGTYKDTITNKVGCDSIISINLTINTVDTAVTVNGGKFESPIGSGDAYQWLTCPTLTPISGENKRVFFPTKGGSYALVILKSGCKDTTNCIQYNMLSSNEYNNDSGIVVYPNPSTDVLYITGAKEFSAVVLEATGKVVMKFSTIIDEVNISSLNPGIYILQLSTEDGNIYRKRFVKE